MPTFFDLQKFAATGIASPDMSAYDKARALAAFGGGKTRTLTGVPPLSFKANGNPLISWSMSGNGSQTGTPTPDAPIMPQFVGVRTANLFDKSTITAGNFATLSGTNANNSYYCSDFIPITAATYYFQNVVGKAYQNSVVVYDANKQGLRYVNISGSTKVSGAMTFQSGDAYIRINCYSQTDVDTVMVNTGNTAQPYEPYGWAEKITCAGQTTPVYLWQTQTVRRIKKLVLDGTEGWVQTYNGAFYIDRQAGCPSDYLKDRTSIIEMCSHYNAQISVSGSNQVVSGNIAFFGVSGATYELYIAARDVASADDFKAYLAQQYANGTPVTIWYVLAEPETGIINEPLAKIGDYADELHSSDTTVTIPTVKGQNVLTVESELPPSEMTITYFEEV